MSIGHASALPGRTRSLPWRRSPAGRSAAGAAAAAFQLLLPPLSAKCPAAGYTCNCLHNTYSRLLCACCPLLLSQDAATRGQAEQALLEFRRSGSVEACAAVLQQSGDEAVRFQVSWPLSLQCLMCLHDCGAGDAALQPARPVQYKPADASTFACHLRSACLPAGGARSARDGARPLGGAGRQHPAGHAAAAAAPCAGAAGWRPAPPAAYPSHRHCRRRHQEGLAGELPCGARRRTANHTRTGHSDRQPGGKAGWAGAARGSCG